MKEMPQDAVKTDYGFKFSRNGTSFRYYQKECTNCKTTTFKEFRNLRHKANVFCTRACQSIYRHKNIDPKGCKILSHKTDADYYYLIGLLATDGHITYPPNYVHYSCSIQLNVEDKDILEKIYSKFGGRLKIYSNNIKWSLNNIEFIDHLKTIGFTHNKTYSLNISEWFDAIPDKNKFHFMRGVIDGDGSIIRNSQNGYRLCLVSASEPFIKMCTDFLEGSYYKDRNTYCMQISKKQKVLDILYKLYSSDFCIKRKYNKAIQLLKEGNYEQSQHI
jgi:hypothetical protein